MTPYKLLLLNIPNSEYKEEIFDALDMSEFRLLININGHIYKHRVRKNGVDTIIAEQEQEQAREEFILLLLRQNKLKLIA